MDLRYPIGASKAHANPDSETLKDWINSIRNFPLQIESQVRSLESDKLDWPYRPEGWTIREVVHHCVDSHLNAFLRFKLTLTEDRPTIKPYQEALWVQLADGKEEDVSNSLLLLQSLHHRWILLIDSLNSDQLKREYFHPENNKTYSLAEVIGTYAWHCEHHLAHVHQAIASEGKYRA